MKTTKLIALSMGVAFAVLSVHAQTFRNLNFEQANPVIDPQGLYYPLDVTAASALPSWTAYVGTVQLTDVIQNAYSTGEASVDIFGANYPIAGPGQGYGTIDGNYSVLLQAGASDPFGNGPFVSASIAQTGRIPLTAQSLEFKTYTPPPVTDFSVSFDGNNLAPVMLGSGPNYTTLYGVNISPYEGHIGTLEFAALFSNTGASALGLDDIAFSTVPLVPEPSIVALSAIGGLLFGARKWFARSSGATT